MGTKVQNHSYLSGYHPIRDLHKNANGSWSAFCEDKTFNGSFCNDFMPRGAGSRPEYDKEMLKRTMLEHEAIFQNQVYELHRLYRIQKELMRELNKKQLNRFSGPTEASKSSMYLSQMPPEYGEKIWHLPHPPLVNSCQRTANVKGVEDKIPSLNFLKKGAMQCSSVSTKKRGCVKDDRPLDTKLKAFPKRMLDLHLPAEVYIENEDTEIKQGEIIAEPRVMAVGTHNMIHEIETKNDVKLTLGSVEVPVCETGILKSNLHPRNGLSIHSLADLNEPIKDSCEEGDEGSGSHKSSCLNMHSEELQQPWTPMRSISNFPQSNFSIDEHRDGVTLNYPNADKIEGRQEWLLLHSDSSQSKIAVNSFDSGLFSEKYPMSSESIKLKLDKARASHLPDPNQRETWLGEKTTHSREISGSLDFLNSSHRGCTASQVTSPFSVVSPLCNASAKSPLASLIKPFRSLNHIPVEVQAPPCFIGSSMLNAKSKNYNAAKQSNSIGSDKLQCNGELQPQISVGSYSSSHANGLHHGIQIYSTSLTGMHLSLTNLEKPNHYNNGDTPYENSEIHEPQKCLKEMQFVDIKSAKNLNLNEVIPGGFQEGLTNKQNLARKHDESSKGLIWLRKKTCCNGSADITDCHTRLDLKFTEDYTSSPEFLRQEIKDKGSSIGILNPYMSSFNFNESKIQSRLVTDCFNYNGILNQADNSQRSFYLSNSVSYNEGQSFADDVKGHEKGKAVRSCTSGLRNNINLNSDLMPVDDAKLFRISAKDETQNLSSFSVKRVTAKPSNNINLEAPADEMEENNTFSGVEIVHMNHPVTPVEMSQETSFLDACMRLAADTIVSMSVDVHNHLDKVTGYPFTPSSSDCLRLLAAVVTSNAEIAGETRGKRYGSYVALDNDGLDDFERMTLKLEELKADDCFCKPCQKEKPKVDDKSMASLLLTKPRRGKARKRRQRDFQKDVLPALASLSRHEVTEDLQALGGMIQAGKSRQTRGRRRPRSTEVNISSPQVQPIHVDLEIKGRNMMVWGRTTRRCRRQRIPSANASAPRE